MRILGLDLGTKTLGIAMSDALGIIAQGVDVFKFSNNDFSKAINKVEEIVKKEKIKTIVLGHPKNMDNSIGERAKMCERFAKKLKDKLDVEVILVDERMTTISATKTLITADVSRKKRKEKVDMLAATIILQSYLDSK